MLFLVFSLIAIAQITFLNKLHGTHYSSIKTYTLGRLLSVMTLGVLTQSYPLCTIVPIEVNKVRSECQGYLSVQSVIDFGIIDSKSSTCFIDRTAPLNSLATNTESTYSSFAETSHPCFQQIDFEIGKSIIEKACIGRRKCEFDGLINKLLPSDSTCVQ